IETFCLLRMMQTHFAEFACVCIQQCDLFELGVIIDSYNDHCSAPFSRACWLFSTTNFTRGWEPTSSWNQYRSLTGTKANGKRKVVISPDNAARRHKRREHRYDSICHKGRRRVPPDSSVFRLHLFA